MMYFTNIEQMIRIHWSDSVLFLGMQEVPYTEEIFIAELEKCGNLLETAERYEVMGPLYRIIIPLLEKRREYEALAEAYHKLHTAYRHVVDVNISGRRLLGTYFRVIFFNQVIHP